MHYVREYIGSPRWQIKGVGSKRNCGAASVGVLQDNLVLELS